MRTPLLTRLQALTVVGIAGGAVALSTLAPVLLPPGAPGATVAAYAAEPDPAPAPDPEPFTLRAERRLDEQRCDVGRVDGRVDARTRAGIVRFQSASGLPQSGRLDAATRDAVRAPTAADCLARPVPPRSGTGRRVVVSQTQNFLWLVGRDGRAFHQAPMVDNPDVLDPGTWRTGSYCGRPARVWRNTDLTGREWLYGFVRFAPCGVGFHQIPIWKSTGRQAHPDWWLGTDKDDSAGCVRLDRRTMRTVWDFTGRATTTVVVLP